VLRAPSLRKAFGQALHDLRTAAGLSQEGLALDAGVDRGHVSNLECGRFQPTLFMVFRLAAALGVEPKDLVARTQRLI
jgi:transcriptional regulator with XRE-family HTH domain